jgi:arsenite-transporting ATPase
VKAGDHRIRNIFFTGKGGSGKSTCCVALACFLSAGGEKVRILSLDPAHSIRLIMHHAAGRGGTEAERIMQAVGVEEPDFDEIRRRWLGDISASVRSRYRYLAALNLDSMADVIRHSPGVNEHIVSRTLWTKLVGGTFEGFTLVDMPATASLHGLVYYVLSSARWMASLKKLHAGIRGSEKWKPAAGEEGDPLGGKIDALGSMLAELAHLLKDERTAFLGIVNPEVLSVSEADSTNRVLEKASAGFRLLVLNKWREGVDEEALAPALGKLTSSMPVARIDLADFEKGDPLVLYAGAGETLWKGLLPRSADEPASAR